MTGFLKTGFGTWMAFWRTRSEHLRRTTICLLLLFGSTQVSLCSQVADSPSDSLKPHLVFPVGNPSSPQAATFSSDGRWLAIGGGSQVQLMDWNTGRTLRQFFSANQFKISSLVISPNGRWLVAAHEDSQIDQWEIDTGQILRSFYDTSDRDVIRSVKLLSADALDLRATTIYLQNLQLSFSPDSRIRASGGIKSIRLWDASTGQKLRELTGIQIEYHKSLDIDAHIASNFPTFPGEISGLRFNKDGRWLAATERSTLYVWDMSTGKLLRKISRFLSSNGTSPLTALSFNGPSSLLVTGDQTGDIQVWDVLTGHQRGSTYHHSDAIRSVFFVQATNSVVSLTAQDIKEWSLKDHKEVRSTPIQTTQPSAVGGYQADVEYADGSEVFFIGRTRINNDGGVVNVTFNPHDSDTFAVSPEQMKLARIHPNADVEIYAVADGQLAKSFKNLTTLT